VKVKINKLYADIVMLFINADRYTQIQHVREMNMFLFTYIEV